jgi:hypothetical protein
VTLAEVEGGDVVVINTGRVGLVRSAYWGDDFVDEGLLFARVGDLADRSTASNNEANPHGSLPISASLVLFGGGAGMLGQRVAEGFGRPTADVISPSVISDDFPIGELATGPCIGLRVAH